MWSCKRRESGCFVGTGTGTGTPLTAMVLAQVLAPALSIKEGDILLKWLLFTTPTPFLLLLLTGCIGVSTKRPICSLAEGLDIAGLDGEFTTQDGGILQKVYIKRLGRGKYSLQTDPWRKKTKILLMSFCKVRGRNVMEYHDYSPASKKISRLSYWPHFFEKTSRHLKLYLADSSIDRLDSKEIPYEILLLREWSPPAKFIVVNRNPSLNGKLVEVMFRAETESNTVIHFGDRTMVSPFFTRAAK